MNPFSLDGKLIVVTGASSGIGRETAVQCANAGASVILIARDAARLAETVSSMPNRDRHITVVNDLTHEDDVAKALVEKLGKRKINGIVHCAGISATLPLRSTSTEKLKTFFEINVFAALALTRLLTKSSFVSENGSSIVFLSSVMSINGEAGKTMYSATKGALVSAARSLAVELAPKKIRVNCISPGVVVTPMTDGAIYSQDEQSRQRVVGMHPLGLGVPSDVAHAVIYLLADASRWVTGSNLIVDGGYSAR